MSEIALDMAVLQGWVCHDIMWTIQPALCYPSTGTWASLCPTLFSNKLYTRCMHHSRQQCSHSCGGSIYCGVLLRLDSSIVHHKECCAASKRISSLFNACTLHRQRASLFVGTGARLGKWLPQMISLHSSNTTAASRLQV